MEKRVSSIKKSDDKKISLALMASFVVLTIQYFVLIAFNLLDTASASRVQLISKFLVGIIFLYALPTVYKKSKIKLIGVYFIAIFVFMINYLLFQNNQVYIRELIFPFFFMCLPAFVYSMSLDDWNVLKQVMKKASFVIFIFGTILGILIFSGGATVGAYSMSLSYYMLLPTIMYIDDFFDNLSLRALLFSLVSLLVILALGSRGALLCTAVFVVLKFIKSNSKLNFKRVFFYLVLFGMSISMIVNFDRILEFIQYFLLKFGINSRSIMLLLRDNIFLSSGRNSIYQNLTGEISNNPLFGIGLGGDRVDGLGYAHNLFLEVMADFGVIAGVIIIIALILLILNSLLIKDKEKYNMLIVWLGLGFVDLMVSGSYLIDMKFWILIGMLTKNSSFISIKGRQQKWSKGKS